MRKPRIVQTETGRKPVTNRGDRREYLVLDASRSKRVGAVMAGGHTVPLGPSGATIYDEGLGEEIKRKYKGSQDVVVCEKSYIGLGDGIHHYTFTGVDTTKLKPSRKETGKWVDVRPGKWVYVKPVEAKTRNKEK